MLKILFSPAEAKNSGGNSEPLKELFFGLKERVDILNSYNSIVLSNNIDTQLKMFGIKKEKDIQRYKHDIFTMPTCKAIYRYSGVAYDYLDITSLDKDAKEYLEDNCIIFSNLYGPVLGSDLITDYKLKQGEKVDDIKTEEFYKERFQKTLDEYLQNSDILDLRAGYYDKFYRPSKEYMTLKFIKNGKVVSHWAKAYRGIVLREVAKNAINSLKDFQKLDISGLHVKEIKKIKLKTEIVFEIL
jgi:cytoplasmic iron level regulating protein YaaA (DUF328/UPF0246 family)